MIEMEEKKIEIINMVHMEMKITRKKKLNLILLSLKIQKINCFFQIMNIMILIRLIGLETLPTQTLPNLMG